MISEALARGLTIRELASRLADDHQDPVVRHFAGEVFKHSELHTAASAIGESLSDELAALKRDIARWEAWIEDAPR